MTNPLSQGVALAWENRRTFGQKKRASIRGELIYECRNALKLSRLLILKKVISHKIYSRAKKSRSKLRG